MNLTGDHLIDAPRERVWAMLNDSDVLRRCLPGCESLEGSPDTGFTAVVAAAVGPVRAKFAGTVTLSEVKPPESYVISGKGSGGVAGFADGAAKVWLVEEGPVTRLHYEAKARIGGKLAQLGSRLVDSTARKLAAEFFSAFSALAQGEGENRGTAEPVSDARAVYGAAPRIAVAGVMLRGAVVVTAVVLVGLLIARLVF